MQELLGVAIDDRVLSARGRSADLLVPEAAARPRRRCSSIAITSIRAQCIYVGAGAQDPGFARRLGFEYRSADDFFGPDAR